MTRPFAGNEIYFDPRAYGARFDGVTDDTVAIQDCIDAATDTANGNIGAIVCMPAGETIISDTIVLRSLTGMTFIGHGRRSTLVTWAGPAGIPAILLDGCNSCVVGDMRMVVAGGLSLHAAVMIGRELGDRASSLNKVRMMEILGGGRMDNGIYIKFFTTGYATDAKNDLHSIEDVQIQSYTDTGIIIEGYNAKKILIKQCFIQGRSTGNYGIDTARFPGHGGSFEMYGGECQENNEWDFRFGKPNDPIVVDGVYGQTAARWFTVINDTDAGPQPTGFWPITFRGHKWSAPNASIPADKIIVAIYTPGPVVLDNCKIGGNSGSGTLKFWYEPRQIAGFAVGTLNILALPVDGETVTLGSDTYTWRNALVAGGLPFEVLIEATVSDSIFNLTYAINLLEDGEGVYYGIGTTVNPDASAARVDASNMRAQALVAGVAGNAIPTSTTMGGGTSWTNGATLIGGAAAAFENVRGSFSVRACAFSCANDDDDFFPNLPPDTLEESFHYDQNGIITWMIPGKGQPYDGGLFVAQTDKDWSERGMRIARAWHDCSRPTGFSQETEQRILDGQKRYLALDLHAFAVPQSQFRQTIAPFSASTCILLNNAASQGLSFEDDDNLLDTTTRNVAIGFTGVLGTPAANGTLIVVGNGASGAGQGPFLRQRTDGLLQLVCDGNSILGTYDYDDGLAHRIILLVDHGSTELNIPQRLMVITDQEVIDYLASFSFPVVLPSIPGKGIGTTAGGLLGPQCYVRMAYAWEGVDVGAVQANGRPGAWAPGDIIPLLTDGTLPTAIGGGFTMSFDYTVTGAEPDLTALVIPLPQTLGSTGYAVFPAQDTATAILGMAVPQATKTTSQFVLQLTAVATAGDVFNFLVKVPQ